MSFESNQHKGGVRNQWKRKNVRRKLVDRERERERVLTLLQEALEDYSVPEFAGAVIRNEEH